MARWPKPPEGSWTEHFDLGTEPISYEDSISPEFYELERDAIFKRSWLNVGRVEQLPRKGSYFTKELAVARTSVVVVRGTDGRDPGLPQRVPSPRQQAGVERLPRARRRAASAASSSASTTAGATTSTGRTPSSSRSPSSSTSTGTTTAWSRCTATCGPGFIFVNVAKGEPEQSLRDFLGPMVTKLENYPFEKLTERYFYRATVNSNWKLYMDAFQEFYHAPVLHAKQTPPDLSTVDAAGRLRGAGLRHRRPAPAGEHGRRPPVGRCPTNMLKPMERITRSGLFGPWDEPDLDFDPKDAGINPAGCDPWGLDSFQVCAQLRDPGLGTELVPDVPLLADRTGSHVFEGTLYFVPPKNGPRACGPARAGRGLLQGVRAPGCQHARGDAADARVTRDRPLPADGPGGALPPPAQGGRPSGWTTTRSPRDAEV